MKRVAGLILLVVVILIVVIITFVSKGKNDQTAIGTNSDKSPIVLKGYVGGEKINFLQDEAVKKILIDSYGLTVQADKRGSIEMVESDDAGRDFLWPSNEIALSIFKQKNPSASSEMIFNSPIVVYSWDKITDILIQNGVVQQLKGTYYIVDFRKLVDLMDKESTWNSLGFSQLNGKLLIYSTDPAKSSSGNLFSALLADVLTGDDPSNEAKLNKELPTIKRFFDKQGFMKEGSKDLFEEFLSRGMGNKQLVIGYEAQLIEYDLENAAAMKNRQNAVRTLYPRPTVWSGHPIIPLTENAKRLIIALKDPKIQEIAWRKHGFRSAVGALNDPKQVGIAGIPDNIDNIVQLPSPAVMDKVAKAIAGKK